MSSNLVRVTLLVGALQFTSFAAASPITFIFQSSGSGALAGTTFTTRDFVITAQGDTASRIDHSGGTFVVYSVAHSSAKIQIGGIGTFDFVTPTRTFVNQTITVVGFSRNTGDLLYETSLPFGSWDMLTNLGPVAARGVLLQWNFSSVETSGGVLRFDNSSTSVPSTFQAIVVPEPLPIVMLAWALIGCMAERRIWRRAIA